VPSGPPSGHGFFFARATAEGDAGDATRAQSVPRAIRCAGPSSGRRWAEACRKAGVTGLHFHDPRGTATRAGEQGASFAEIMQLLTQSTPTAALRYQHATDERRLMITDGKGDLVDKAPTPSANVVQKSRRVARYSTEFNGRKSAHMLVAPHEDFPWSLAVSEGGRPQIPTGECLLGYPHSRRSKYVLADALGFVLNRGSSLAGQLSCRR
jgi:hypothetical protein